MKKAMSPEQPFTNFIIELIDVSVEVSESTFYVSVLPGPPFVQNAMGSVAGLFMLSTNQ